MSSLEGMRLSCIATRCHGSTLKSSLEVAPMEYPPARFEDEMMAPCPLENNAGSAVTCLFGD